MAQGKARITDLKDKIGAVVRMVGSCQTSIKEMKEAIAKNEKLFKTAAGRSESQLS